MKLPQQQLRTSLQQKIHPIYLISGDETLLIQETLNQILDAAKKYEFMEKQVFHVENGFNWEEFLAATNNLSLFSDKLILELHLQSKLTENASKILQSYAAKNRDDKILIIITGKLDAAMQKTAWYKAIDQIGITIQIWPIDAKQMPSWICQRLHQAGIKTDQAGVQLLVEYSAGNLLAAQQEIEKLSLNYGNKVLSSDEILAVLTDNSKFNIYNFTDSFLQDDKKLSLKILDNIKRDGTEPTLILWAITRELHNLINIATSIQDGISMESALEKHKVWMSRKAATKKILQKYNIDALYNILQKCTRLDLIIKGAESRDFWLELERVVAFVGTSIKL